MFVQAFATMLALTNLMNSNPSSNYSYGNIQFVTCSDEARETIVSTSYDYVSLYNTTMSYYDVNLGQYASSGDDFYMLRYPIYTQVSSNSGIVAGYFDFWFNVDNPPNLELSLHYRFTRAGTNYLTFNLKSFVRFELASSSGGTILHTPSYTMDWMDIDISSYSFTLALGEQFLITNTSANFNINFTNLPVTENEFSNVVVPQQSYQDGYIDGHQVGYNEGITYAQEQNQTALTIFTGIVDVGLLPINFFLSMLNFEVFGINIGSIVSATLTVAVLLIVIRIVTGKKSED